MVNTLWSIADLIASKHNSNHTTQQMTLEGEIIEQKYSYYCFGVVPADVVRLKKNVWFSRLDRDQIDRMEEYFRSVRGEKWWKTKKH